MVPNVMEILARVKPAKQSDQIRNVWLDIKLLRAGRLTYEQIRVNYLPEVGISEITYRTFVTICSRLSREEQDSGAPIERGPTIEVPRKSVGNSQGGTGASILSPIDRAKQKVAAEERRNERWRVGE
jgi:hypothetical protein